MQHYYGDIVRRLFLAAGVVMIFSLPFVYQFIPLPFILSILTIFGVVFFAGLLSPIQRWLIVHNVMISAGPFILFEFYAVSAYLAADESFFLVNQVLALIFIFALYFSSKTVRGTVINNSKDLEEKEGEEAAVAILKMRYAEGEIKKKEFEEKLEEIRKAK